ncbi:isopentenyl-diphosphate delta-isomerase [Filimonas lacunae]|uniref:Isopentenyl-diphosphate delta-isomerase n=1 Tax=Filimonas lacunae TaxID=477680 RepID=A0A173MS81_9BACT|nr:isopentenyl-diphosphate Delta-isomerase [Filimonas lacunae]BAV10218.1 isopentenyl-diphosphate delta-isomerase [Filimonas lacunae]SIT18137.1 isopentenyl-diphosphate delta-isomerase [Filimonas lacunae]
MEEVTLVDEFDREVGTMEKMTAHREAALHRAFSVFIFNSKGDMLLQQRAVQKYHSGGLWTNACCSHPKPGENIMQAAQKRLQEEMGFTTELEKAFDFIYRAELDNNLIEHELDHVFIGEYNGLILPDAAEVKDYCFKSIESILESLQLQPHKYTAWFHIALPRVIEWVDIRKGIIVE